MARGTLNTWMYQPLADEAVGVIPLDALSKNMKQLEKSCQIIVISPKSLESFKIIQKPPGSHWFPNWRRFPSWRPFQLEIQTLPVLLLKGTQQGLRIVRFCPSQMKQIWLRLNLRDLNAWSSQVVLKHSRFEQVNQRLLMEPRRTATGAALTWCACG